MPVKLLSWNVCAGGGDVRRPKQLRAIAKIKPDIVALQEVTAGSVESYRNGLVDVGLKHVIDSFALRSGASWALGGTVNSSRVGGRLRI